MDNYIKNIIKDVSKKIGIELSKEDIQFYTDGNSASIVFNVLNKYLIKTLDNKSLDTHLIFFNYYTDISNFQKIVFFNKKLNYICFEFIEGKLFKENNTIDILNIINQIYNVVIQYKNYNYEKFGYLLEENKEWKEFLTDEVYNSSKYIKNLNICTNKVFKAIDKISSFPIDKKLIHGDFGVHNFLIDNSNKLKIIDPMPLIGDYLYDFYFAIFSNTILFKEIDINYILSFFENENIDKKRSLLLIIIFIRMGRCYKYNKEDFNIYYKIYNSYNI